MANTNVTGTHETYGYEAFSLCPEKRHELEKISCSLSSFSESELLELRGKRIRVLQSFKYQPVSRFVAQVMAVSLPVQGSGLETSVLLREEGCNAEELDYVDAAQLTLLEVLSAPAN